MPKGLVVPGLSVLSVEAKKAKGRDETALRSTHTQPKSTSLNKKLFLGTAETVSANEEDKILEFHYPLLTSTDGDTKAQRKEGICQCLGTS